MAQQPPLLGLTAVVTGATRGIGRSVSERLSADGAKVIGIGSSASGSVPDGVEYQALDLSDLAAVEKYGVRLTSLGPDILVNNAGINRVSPFSEIELGNFEHLLRVNVLAPFLLCRAVLQPMREKKWGRIVNISSIWGKIGKSGRAPYAATKFGLDGMTLALAAEVSEDGIMCNCVAPGFIDTELTRKNLSGDEQEKLARQVPVMRFGQPHEVASLVAWLVSPENTYVTGQNIAIDGGFSRV